MLTRPSGLPKARRRRVAGRARPKRDAPSSALATHLLAYSGAFLVLGVVVKAVRVARMDLTTAQFLLIHGDVPHVVAGTLLLLMPGLVPIAAAVNIWHVRRLLSKRRQAAPSEFLLSLFGLTVVLGVAVAAMPAAMLFWPVVVAVGFAASLGAEKLRKRWGPSRGNRQRSNSTLAAALVLALMGSYPLLGTLFNDVVWLPAERVQVDAGASFTAYEIERDGDLIVLLRDTDRRVLLVHSSALRSATPCRLTRLVNSRRTALDLLLGHSGPNTPAC